MSISDPDHLPPAQGLPQQRPLLTTSVVIYATLALLAVTIPRGLVNWAKNFEPGAPQQAVLQVAEAIAAASHRIGATGPLTRPRTVPAGDRQARRLELAGVDEVIGALAWLDGRDESSDLSPCVFDRPPLSHAHPVFDLCEGLLDRVEIG